MNFLHKYLPWSLSVILLVTAGFLIAPTAKADVSLDSASAIRNNFVSGNTYASPAINVGAGKAVVVGCTVFLSANTGLATTGVTDTAGNSFTKVAETVNSNGDVVALWLAFNSIANAADVANCTWNASSGAANSHQQSIAAYSGAGGYESPQVNSSASQAVPWTISGTVTTMPGDVIVGFYAGQGPTGMVAPAVSEAIAVSGNSIYGDYGLGLNLAPSTYSMSITGSVSPGHWAGVDVALTPSARTQVIVQNAQAIIMSSQTIIK